MVNRASSLGAMIQANNGMQLYATSGPFDEQALAESAPIGAVSNAAHIAVLRYPLMGSASRADSRMDQQYN